MKIRPIREWLSVRRLVMVALGVLVLVGAGAATTVHALGSGLPDDVAIRVGHTDITTTELTQRTAVLKALYGIEDPGGARSATFQRDVAQAVAMSTILDQASATRGITITDRSAQDTLSSMIKQQLGSTGTDPQTAFTDLLGQYGVTEDEVLAEIKRQQSIALLFTDVTRTVVSAVTATDAKALYQQNPSRFATPATRTLRNIVVSTKAKATQILHELRAGKAFATLARKDSLDASTRDQGGGLGAVSADQLDATYAKAAFAAPKGALFGPVKSSYGWNVGQVEKITPAVHHTYASVSDQVLDAVQSDRATAAWAAWLQQQLVAAHVQYADAYRPADPDALPSGLAEPITSPTSAP